MASQGTPVKKKGSGIAFVLPDVRKDNEAPAAAPAAPRNVPRTGVGLLATTVFETAKLEERIESLQGEVRKLEAERGGQLMDARSIVPSRWANRHPDAFVGAEFEELKREILEAGGNVQPIKVRPLASPRPGEGGVEARYEIVFGHRRHRACLELGLPVLCVVQDLADQELFVHMERENRGRQSLSAWEQGRMYLRALDEGLFPSNRQLAAAIGRSLSDIGKALRIAQLPSEVVGAFPSPNAIQFRWATDLQRALEKDADTVLAAARAADRTRSPWTAAEAYAALTACLRPQGVGRSHSPVREVDLGAGRQATLRSDAQGRTVVELSAGVLPVDRWPAFEAALRELLG
ncbi:ParB/RepB/Spo0J family partition protein [Azohydromonas caseinilytica]|uniref:ParB/RepB/Spo0J family partition protein n=1 Tax=Azohydromonas caseinilytica TaxID=2728836 RepID=A0A848FEM3_9BURK|nr:ParB/RepB/Spo0J family partition protein [Azohydromonas caseinilytica]NML17854.1 ParB/RepB/Spo0J family partition protein [Azohydromonas caseinilytica]